MKTPFTRRLTLIALPLLLASCAVFQPKRKGAFVSPEFSQKKPRQVAVLLFDNTTLDLLAPEMLRTLARERLREKGYPGPELAAVDSKLHDMGVSDGGQLSAIKPMDLGQRLNIDGLLYGTIEDFTFADVGFGIRRAVRLKLTLVRADDGDKLWVHEDIESNLHVRESPDAAERSINESTVERGKLDLQKRPLYKESNAVLDKLFLTLPPR